MNRKGGEIKICEEGREMIRRKLKRGNTIRRDEEEKTGERQR
jgi:hypothetical protein